MGITQAKTRTGSAAAKDGPTAGTSNSSNEIVRTKSPPGLNSTGAGWRALAATRWRAAVSEIL